MGDYHVSELNTLFRKRNGKRRRVSSYDVTGGNDDFLILQPGETRTFACLEGPGVITHFWCTMGNCDPASESGAMGHEEFNVRKTVLKIFWDGEENPSVQAPIGDFFGMGHGITRNFSSQPLQMSPQDGHAFNCWFPMPFRKEAKFVLTNECNTVMRYYFYLDYEAVPQLPEDTLYFHAVWNREFPTEGVPKEERATHADWIFGGPQDKNTTGDGNYVILEAEGSGHYVGCNLNIHNLNMSMLWDWPGEGDDMIFIDGEKWPCSLHGTGTEDYFNTCWSPTETQCTPWHGIILAADEHYKGRYTFYRYHVQDPVMFEKSIKVTMEHGHNNLRSDDYSSTAYWYQQEPHKPLPEILPVDRRLPVDEHLMWWTGKIRHCENRALIK